MLPYLSFRKRFFSNYTFQGNPNRANHSYFSSNIDAHPGKQLRVAALDTAMSTVRLSNPGSMRCGVMGQQHDDGDVDVAGRQADRPCMISVLKCPKCPLYLTVHWIKTG